MEVITSFWFCSNALPTMPGGRKLGFGSERRVSNVLITFSRVLKAGLSELDYGIFA